MPHARPPRRTHYEIGADTRPVDRMEGVEDHSIKPPLVVMDGANIAYAYGAALQGNHIQSKPLPDARGIHVACQYFALADLRILVVLPSSWFRNVTRAHTNDDLELKETVRQLDQAGYLVPAPPTDDDDAYALTIAQRENARSLTSPLHGPGYVLSNDLFRDAQSRDVSGELGVWLNQGNPSAAATASSLARAVDQDRPHGPGRISYTFCDMGAMDDRGCKQLDFVPNPRHPLVAWVESHHRQQPHR